MTDLTAKIWTHPTSGEYRIYVNGVGSGIKVWLVPGKYGPALRDVQIRTNADYLPARWYDGTAGAPDPAQAALENVYDALIKALGIPERPWFDDLFSSLNFGGWDQARHDERVAARNAEYAAEQKAGAERKAAAVKASVAGRPPATANRPTYKNRKTRLAALAPFIEPSDRMDAVKVIKKWAGLSKRETALYPAAIRIAARSGGAVAWEDALYTLLHDVDVDGFTQQPRC